MGKQKHGHLQDKQFNKFSIQNLLRRLNFLFKSPNEKESHFSLSFNENYLFSQL